MRRRDNGAPVSSDGRYVLYWMTSSRRLTDNFALDRAVHWAKELDQPLLIFEPLRAGYAYASDRHHRFVIDGMVDNQRRAEAAGVGYFPYVEPAHGDARGLLAALAERASVVVGDDNVGFFYPRMLDAAMKRSAVLMELVDSNGLLPLDATDRRFTTAHSFRRFLHKTLLDHLTFPSEDPLADVPGGVPRLPNGVASKWPRANLSKVDELIASTKIDHSVPPVALKGGPVAGAARIEALLESGVERGSGMSPYLHFGHVGAHQVFRAITKGVWSPADVTGPHNGRREGWWGMDANRESFIDELLTWRELGVNGVKTIENYDRYESLPEWAIATLEDHANDPREHLYSLAEFEDAATHDELWNAAQRQLVRDGTIHNYLRMLWGKKILEWTPHPRNALEIMLELNDKYAVDGRDPNSISGIFWVLGRYDRAWGPERPIFGKIRFMSSDNTRRKMKLADYLAKYA